MSNLEAPARASASAMPQGVTDKNYKPLPGRLGNLTVPQQHALDKFKKELQEEGFLSRKEWMMPHFYGSFLSLLFFRLSTLSSFCVLDSSEHENLMSP